MSNPTAGDVHVDAALSNISLAYTQAQSSFIAGLVFPDVSVDKQSDKYFTYDRNSWFRDEMKKRADGAQTAGGGYNISTDSFFCDVWGVHKDIGPQARANSDAAINLEMDAARWVALQGMIRKERQFVADFFGTGIWTTDKVGATDFTTWDNEASSDPIEDIKDGRVLMLKSTGQKANTLTVGYEVHEALKKHPLVLERYKVTNTDSITADMIARVLDIERYLVSEAVYATNAEGAAATYDFALGKHALLTHSAPTPGLLTPSAGYTFSWAGLTGVNNMGMRTSRMDIPLTGGAIRVEGEIAFDMKTVAPDLGYFFSGAVV